MAKLSVTLETSAGTVTFDGPDLPDATMDRFINWNLYAYPQVDEDGNPVPVTSAVKAAAFQDFGAGFWSGVKANVLRWERNEAAQAASEAVGEIE